MLRDLGFPRRDHYVASHSNFQPDLVLPIFNITFDLTIHQIREFLEEMKIELGSTLKQKPNEVHFFHSLMPMTKDYLPCTFIFLQRHEVTPY